MKIDGTGVTPRPFQCSSADRTASAYSPDASTWQAASASSPTDAAASINTLGPEMSPLAEVSRAKPLLVRVLLAFDVGSIQQLVGIKLVVDAAVLPNRNGQASVGGSLAPP